MEANFFKDVQNLTIGNGNFVMNTGPDNSRKTINHNHNTTINDRSRRVTNYGGYTNYGQHADGSGQINNYGPQTTNNGPVHGYAQYGSNYYPYPARKNWAPSSYDDDNFDDDNFNDNFQAPARGQSYAYQPRVQPDRLHPGDRDYFGRYPPASQSESQLGNKRPKEPDFPRSKTDLPNRPTKVAFDITSPQFRKEYESMSPQLKAYCRDLGFDPQESLTDRMANVTLDDPDLQRTHSPGTYGRRTPDVPRKGKHIAHDSESDDSEDDDQLDEADYDPPNGGQHYSSSYTHNDNRVITKHINSHNVNTENVVDSYNDNSTRTDINKNTAR